MLLQDQVLMQLQLHMAPYDIYPERLEELLSEDMDFHNEHSGYASHNYHSFPAKFPPQLPSKFILGLTEPGDTVLDPMMGSGTTVLESFLGGRRGIGFDIDPLALLVTKVKVTPVKVEETAALGNEVVQKAIVAINTRRAALEEELQTRWSPATKEFTDYWFSPSVQIELLALITEIDQVQDEAIRDFLRLAFSSIIITKSGGVSLGLDLAHTRPHKAKKIIDIDGTVIFGEELTVDSSRNLHILTKKLRSPLVEFEKRVLKNLDGVQQPRQSRVDPLVRHADAQYMPLANESVDLIFTSPPYASNAIDYMRAHKFSLVWLGYSIDDLGEKRKDYIGGEVTKNIDLEDMPYNTAQLVQSLACEDKRRSLVLHRYYSEMKRVLQEMLRVLKPGKAAILVVGNSMMKGVDIKIAECLGEIGEAVGFYAPRIGVRNLDRNRRMLPASTKVNLDSQIQQRMHEEYIISFIKP